MLYNITIYTIVFLNICTFYDSEYLKSFDTVKKQFTGIASFIPVWVAVVIIDIILVAYDPLATTNDEEMLILRKF